MNCLEKCIMDSEPNTTFTFVRKGDSKQTFTLAETGELVAFNSKTGWLMVIDQDGHFVDKYRPIRDINGTLVTYEDYFSKY